MNCHESLMARRRKKSKAAAQAKQREKDASPMITDKSLPALPPNAVPPNAFSNDRVTPESDTPTELSPRPRAAYGLNEPSSRSGSRPDRSPERSQEPAKDSSLAPSAGTYRHNRSSAIFSGSMDNGDPDGGFFIPVALDPSPGPALTPQSMSDAYTESSKRTKDRDYFTPKPQPAEKRSDSQASTPHIAFQEKPRQPSSDYEAPQQERPARKLSKRNGNSRASPGTEDGKASNTKSQPNEEFRLQDAPKNKRLANSRSNSLSGHSLDLSTLAKAPPAPPRNRDVLSNATNVDSPRQPGAADNAPPPRPSQDPRRRDDDAARPSAEPSASNRPEVFPPPPIARKEVPSSQSRNGKLTMPECAQGKQLDKLTKDESSQRQRSCSASAPSDVRDKAKRHLHATQGATSAPLSACEGTHDFTQRGRGIQNVAQVTTLELGGRFYSGRGFSQDTRD